MRRRSRDRALPPPAATAAPGAPEALAGEAMHSVVAEILSGIPAGCTWLLPVFDPAGTVADFRIAAVSAQAVDVAGRPGDDRIGRHLRDLYPTMVGGPLWKLYLQVLGSGQPAQLPDFRYTELRAGVVAESMFDVSVHPVCGGLLVWWQRLDEDRRRLEQTELLGNLGWGETDLTTDVTTWSPGMYRIFERDPALGPMTRKQQAEAVLPDDQPLRETAWQMLDSGLVSDLTIRVRVGGSVKHLRLLADTARDAAGRPVKVYGVVQDVTAREDSRTSVERLSRELRQRELTAVAEQRLAAQLQQIIQPLPEDVFALDGLEILVNYLPAENTVRVGGDWYHALPLPDGRVLLAIGDVVGHGLAAATSMAHLRYSLTAWTSVGIDDPGALLGHMNKLCLRLQTTATAVIAVYDPPTGSLRWARAGHPLPLHTRDGHTTELRRVDGLLLGVSPEAAYPLGECQLRAGDLLTFYTDGLVERRDRGSESVLAELARILSALDTSDGGGLERLRAGLPPANEHDDSCVLALRVAA